MNYQHIARLAELVNDVSDLTTDTPRFCVRVAFSCLYKTPSFDLDLTSWSDDYPSGISGIYFHTSRGDHDDDAYTTDELIQMLEQIKACGFRDDQEQVA